MSRTCEICGKHPVHGNTVSKSYNHSRRQWKPNLIKIKTEIFGKTETIKICTRCLRTNTTLAIKKLNVTPANAGAPKAE